MHARAQQGRGKQAQGQTLETQELRRLGGQWLRSLREARGLSQLALARELGIEYYTFISQIEAGRGRIPPDRYGVWAQALGQEPSGFVTEILRYYEPVTWRYLFGDKDCNENDTGLGKTVKEPV